MPVVTRRLSGKTEVTYHSKPVAATPTISIVLHLRACSYLGDYGAGQTIKTFSLLPGEKTTITVRSYQQYEQTRRQAENILDSFSESSAEDLQDTVEEQTQFTTGSTKTETEAKTGNWNAGGSLGLNLGIFQIGGGGGGGGTTASSDTFNSAVQSQVGALTSAISHHVSKSDKARQIEVNSESSDRSLTENEETIVRVLENINHSRVLNFVFRQLLQEYFTITYLHDVSIVYYNGFPESRRSVKLSGLDGLLQEVLVDAGAVTSVKNQIYTQLCNIEDYTGTLVSFIERVQHSVVNCIDPGPPQAQSYVRKRDELQQTYRGRTVKGIILDVTERIIRTPSLVSDALLGQGEALDCYNQQLQDAAVTMARTQNDRAIADNTRLDAENQRKQQEMDAAEMIIKSISDPMEQAKLFKKVFGDCCDVPQSMCGCWEKPGEEPKP